jgi:hypothetical protein
MCVSMGAGACAASGPAAQQTAAASRMSLQDASMRRTLMLDVMVVVEIGRSSKGLKMRATSRGEAAAT